MKRKIAMLLSAVMVASAMPMSAMAASTNSISKTTTANAEKTVSAGNLEIRPTGSFEAGDVFYITLENATFNKEKFQELHGYKGVTVNGTLVDFDGFKDSEATIGTDISDMTKYAAAVNSESNPIKVEANGDTEPFYIPYKITWESDTTAAIELLPFNQNYIANSNYQINGVSPYVSIPLAGIIAEDSGDIKVTIDNNETSITAGTYTVGTIYSGSGSTVTTAASVITFDGTETLDKITVKENVAGTLAVDKTITLKLSSGFNFANSNNSEITLTFRNANKSSEKVTITKTADNTITFKIPSDITFSEGKIGQFVIDGLKVEAADEEKNYGNVKLTISGESGSGITTETIEVAKREQASFTMELVNEPTTIIAGRTHVAGEESGKTIQNSDLEAESFQTAKVRFSENVAGAWSSQRLDFTVPEGVQIVGVDFTKVSNAGSLTTSTDIVDGDTTVEISGTNGTTTIQITNNGRTLRFPKDFNQFISTTNATSFDMVLKLSVQAGYEGDITLSAVGAGASAGDIKDVVIAKAIQPVSIETKATSLNVGYQSYNTADITIVENVAGALLEGKEVEISLDGTFNNTEIALTGATVTTTSDELVISNVKVSGGVIKFTIDSASYNNPATIKISNVTVGTTRSIPYGSYNLKFGGDAIINNYSSTNYATASSAYQNFAYNNNISSYSTEYINIVTSTGTLDNTVKVTIGEKTVLINDQAVDIDVAPYIQASSNSTLVPLRFVTVALGLDGDVSSADETSKISFDANTKTATIYYGSGASATIIQFQDGSNVMKIGNVSVNMENGVKAEIQNDRMFVPFRALGQALGVNVSWDEETRTAIYNAR